MKYFTLLILPFLLAVSSFPGTPKSTIKPARLLHLSFHEGCLGEFDNLAQHFGFEIDNWYIPSLSSMEFDGVTDSNYQRHFITRERAKNIWEFNKEIFNSYDGIVVSDIVTLCRIFLQNGYKKPLIIWVTNRFDLTFDYKKFPNYPDEDYYRMLNDAKDLPNVKVIGWSEYEKVHAERSGVFSIERIIKPVGFQHLSFHQDQFKAVPKQIDKPNNYFVRKYINEKYMKIETLLKKENIPFYMGSYAGPADIAPFKGFIHIPCVMSNFHLFENLQHGIIHFIPSKTFYRHLYLDKGIRFVFWIHLNRHSITPIDDIFDYSEWYDSDHEDLFVHFDSFADLKRKLSEIDPEPIKERIEAFGKVHRESMLAAWEEVFQQLGICR